MSIETMPSYIGPHQERYVFVVKRNTNNSTRNDLGDYAHVSRYLFLLQSNNEGIFGQYLRDTWYSENLNTSDSREYMIIPINQSTCWKKIKETIESHVTFDTTASNLLEILNQKYDVDCIYNFDLSKHVIQNLMNNTTNNFTHTLNCVDNPNMKFTFCVTLLKEDYNIDCLRIELPDFKIIYK